MASQKLSFEFFDISVQNSSNVFYAWHYYGNPRTPEIAVENALALQQEWNVPSFNTEFGGCDAWNACEAADISHTYWHYSRLVTSKSCDDKSHNGTDMQENMCTWLRDSCPGMRVIHAT